MRVIILGLTEKGLKWQHITKDECVAVLDAIDPAANFQNIHELAVSSYDAVIICANDEPKYNLIRYALANKKHVLVERPLMCLDQEQIDELEHLARVNNVVCYMSSSFRFEPHFIRMKRLLDSKTLGEIYHCSLFISDNTARVVFTDLGANLLDLLYFWFGSKIKASNFSIVTKRTLKESTPDHVIFADFSSKLTIKVEMTSLPYKTDFSCDLMAKYGSVHIKSLCKWGGSSYLSFQQDLDTDSIIEENESIVQNNDPTLEQEYLHFKQLCADPDSITDLHSEQWIDTEIMRLSDEELLIA